MKAITLHIYILWNSTGLKSSIHRRRDSTRHLSRVGVNGVYRLNILQRNILRCYRCSFLKLWLGSVVVRASEQ